MGFAIVKPRKIKKEEIILISGTENLSDTSIGDSFYDSFDDNIFIIENDDQLQSIKTDINGIYNFILYKIIASQNQISPELLVKFNSDLDNWFNDVPFIIIEMMIDENGKRVPKLTNGCITQFELPLIIKQLMDNKKINDLTSYVSGILDCYYAFNQFGIYTKADMFELLSDFKNHIGLLRGIQVLDSDINKFIESKIK